jgi:hypothetical protein
MIKSHLLGALLIGALTTERAAGQQPAPGNLIATATAPTTVNLKWTGAAGANGYVVLRAVGSDPFGRLTEKKLSASTAAYTDSVAPVGSALRYRIRAIFGNGQTSVSAIAKVTTPAAPANTASGNQTTDPPPPPGQPTTEPTVPPSSGEQTVARAEARPITGYRAVAPTGTVLRALDPAGSSTPTPEAPAGFTARDAGEGKVRFEWRAVAGAVNYRLEGTGLPGGGLVESGTAVTATGIPPGPGNWQIRAVYPNDFSDPGVTSRASAVIRFAPSHPSWLTKNNGKGSLGTSMTHYMSLCPLCLPGTTFSDLATHVGLPITEIVGPYGASDYGTDIGPGTEAHYQNVTEFGTSRATRCWELPPASGNPLLLVPRTLCYALSGDHGLSVIVKRLNESWFFSYTEPPPRPYEGQGVFDYKLVDRVVLDSEGPKFAPHACLACHGGSYDSQTGKVTGSTLLPLDPNRLVFSNEPGKTRAEQEDKIRQVNTAVLASAPSPAVARYIRGLYGGEPRTRAVPAQQDYVPREWLDQAGLYRNVVRPYCATCHMAAPAHIDFSSSTNFFQNRTHIQASVCSSRSMPHAELPFKTFWTKDTGPVYLPGLLSAALGFSSCPS